MVELKEREATISDTVVRTVDAVEAGPVSVERSAVGVVSGDTIEIARAGAGLLFARRDLTLRQGGGRTLVAGGDVELHQAGAGSVLVAGNAAIERGGAGSIVAAGSV